MAEKENNQERVLIHVLITVRDREGRPYPRKVFKQILSEFEEFGGWSLFSKEPLPGGWRDPETGEIERETSWRYEIGIRTEDLRKFDDYLSELASRLGQESIWRAIMGTGRAIPSRKEETK